ncbi:MAG TPA: deoxyribonuclease IV [Firmicutes bacterium]|nr:deoxyribonuclease IV [Bacillota bacterium]
MKCFGAHVSAAGGVHKAPERAAALGANAFAFFTKNQRQWASPPLSGEIISMFKTGLKKAGISPLHVLPHDSYLINLAHPEKGKREKSVHAFIDEARRVEDLGLLYLNFHPGSSLGCCDKKEALKNVATGINRAVSETQNCVYVIENTAGQGDQLGASLEEIEQILEKVTHRERTGVCIDTCHAHAAGYDLISEEGFSTFWILFEKALDWNLLKAMHLNDAIKERGSRVDRHASLGEGFLGWRPFQRIARDKRFDNRPLILETPRPEIWDDEIERLFAYAGS